MIKYGLISDVDSRCLEKTMDLIREEFPKDSLEFTEVGIYSGETGLNMTRYFNSIGMPSWWTGIDNSKDGQEVLFKPDNFIQGNSNEVYNQLEDESQHLIFIDGLHTFAGVISDFFCYAGKVKKGAYLAFHDTGKHLDPLSGWQGVGDKNDPDFCLGGVRKALKHIGMFSRVDALNNQICSLNGQWQLIFDEADPNDTGGGICVFKKLY